MDFSWATPLEWLVLDALILAVLVHQVVQFMRDRARRRSARTAVEPSSGFPKKRF